MSTEQIAILSGAAVGVAGVLAPTLTARLGRIHERSLARAERQHATRAQVYERAGAYLERQRIAHLRTESLIGPVADPPPPLSDDEWAQLEGSIAVASSPEVRAAIAEAHRRGNLFFGSVIAYRGVAEAPQQAPGARQQMDESRQRAIDAIDEAERVMRDELVAL